MQKRKFHWEKSILFLPIFFALVAYLFSKKSLPLVLFFCISITHFFSAQIYIADSTTFISNSKQFSTQINLQKSFSKIEKATEKAEFYVEKGTIISGIEEIYVGNKTSTIVENTPKPTAKLAPKEKAIAVEKLIATTTIQKVTKKTVLAPAFVFKAVDPASQFATANFKNNASAVILLHYNYIVAVKSANYHTQFLFYIETNLPNNALAIFGNRDATSSNFTRPPPVLA